MSAHPRYPVFIPTKGRADSRLTIKAFERIGVDFLAVVEPQEFDDYAAVVDPAKLLVLPFSDRGLVPTRNWIWDYAESLGVPYFWTFDDNIRGFYRYNRNLKTPVGDGRIFYVMEEFVDRYENIAIAGANYMMFVKAKFCPPPYYPNTRVYSNMLINMSARDRDGRPYRNNGVYNDDTDLCLRVLKDGWCTMLFNAFLIEKQQTMMIAGGMTPFYKDGAAQELEDGTLARVEGDGRLKMARELVAAHPDVASLSWKFGHWQHHVDYSGFIRRNKLRLKPGVEVAQRVNDFGMVLQRLEDGEWVDRPDLWPRRAEELPLEAESAALVEAEAHDAAEAAVEDEAAPEPQTLLDLLEESWG